MAEFFHLLQESGLLTAAFIIGAIAVVLAIVGRFKTIVELSRGRAFLLALFGLFLMALSIIGYFISLQATPRAAEVPTREPESVTSGSPTSIPAFTPQVIPTSAPATNTPSAPVPPTPTPVPVVVGTVRVPGYLEDGARFNCEKTGRYVITIDSGAYSPWPTDDYPGNQGWLTTLYIYENGSVEWGTRETGLTGPVSPDYSIGWGEPKPTQSEAESVARGMSITVDLQAGDYLTFVPIDEQTAYNYPANNRGEVVLSVSLILSP